MKSVDNSAKPGLALREIGALKHQPTRPAKHPPASNSRCPTDGTTAYTNPNTPDGMTMLHGDGTTQLVGAGMGLVDACAARQTGRPLPTIR